MIIHLKRNEKLYLNGAVIKLDRRGTIELLNDADFLLENHIMQPEDAITPLRRLYFLVQAMLMDPKNSHLMRELFKINLVQVREAVLDQEFLHVLKEVEFRVMGGRFFEAMKTIRQNYHIERGGHPLGMEPVARREVAA
jgi:flagellar biosynthesis repressor protein FlbT